MNLPRVLRVLLILGSFALASGLVANGCGSSNNNAGTTGQTAPPSIPMPAALKFKKINQEVQQQQQQLGPLCPKHFKMEIQASGQVDFFDPSGAMFLAGQAPQDQLALVATTANDIVTAGVQQQVSCKSDQAPSQMQVGVQQFMITDQQDNTDLVAAQNNASFCDFSKASKGLLLQQQMQQVATLSCTGHLPPKLMPAPPPPPRLPPRPLPPQPLPPPPPPRPSPRPPTVSIPPQAGNVACDAAASQLSLDLEAARQCLQDSDCNYVDGLDVVPRETIGMFVTEFSCGNITPSIVVANGRYIEDNISRINQDISGYTDACPAAHLTSGCGSVGGFTINAPPICRAGVCAKGTAIPTATPTEAPSP